ncbi:ferrichrome ABC transporter substrate-binding protein [Saccharibacillus sp. O23]|uniref:ABC transporter substrate-binding protein n=1 Tax=Saccharibacillus sp. O23 TaxID=2009338 RepID=UPI000B4E0585|nr:ABC transporter substrate-binding protein [Saccharibacillus sp. O23]OWR30411.1 ferrichrome ABC transporter substrate-binding protein [Saccharibacillus sp. O23]
MNHGNAIKFKFGAMALVLAAGTALAGCGANGDNPSATADSATASTGQQEASASSAQSAADTGKQGPDNGGETRVVKGEFGDVTIPAHPERPAGIYLEDYMVALGVTPIVQWYHPNWGIQDYLKLDVPQFDISGSPEAMLAQQPDLIMLDGGMDQAAYETYSKIAPTYRLPQSVLEDPRKVLLAVADALGIPDKGQEVLANYDRTIAEDKAKLEKAVGGETVAVLRLNGGDKTMALFGEKNNYTGMIYSQLGLTPHPLVSGMNDYQEIISEEGLADLDADHIFIFPARGDWDSAENKEAEKLLDRPIWKSLKAVKSGHVYVVERSYWQSGGIQANLLKFADIMKHLAP